MPVFLIPVLIRLGVAGLAALTAYLVAKQQHAAALAVGAAGGAILSEVQPLVKGRKKDDVP